jgi:hypothetical protein
MQGDEQIIARFMIEQLQFYGIRNAAEAATCLAFDDRARSVCRKIVRNRGLYRRSPSRID